MLTEPSSAASSASARAPGSPPRRRGGAGARGRTGGRQPVVTAEKLRRARDLVAKGLTVRDAAVRLRVGKTALYDALKLPVRSGKPDTQRTSVS